MGLDMYLKASTYGSGYDFNGEEEVKKYRNLVDGFGAEAIADPDTPSYVFSVTALYWRKSNAIHKWFVDNVQDGTDDCGTYYVGREQLEQLRDTCKKVVESLKLVPGKVNAGQIMKEGGWEDILEDGEVATNTSVAEELLPTGSGFFFGSTDYDGWYAQDLQRTVEGIDRLLEATKGSEENPFSGWDFYYNSSW